jgi:tRNA(Arg) A34 adenosine deaminase TadA
MPDHLHFLEKAFAVAKRSMDKGNLPFGCLLTGPDNTILIEGENTVVTDNDAIAHCEINLVHQLKGKYEPDFLQQCTVYATTEPCPMCAGAIFWSGIGNLVYALSKETFHHIAGTQNPAHILDMKAEELLHRGGTGGKDTWPAYGGKRKGDL